MKAKKGNKAESKKSPKKLTQKEKEVLRELEELLGKKTSLVGVLFLGSARPVDTGDEQSFSA